MGLFYKYLLSYAPVKMAECTGNLIGGYPNKCQLLSSSIK